MAKKTTKPAPRARPLDLIWTRPAKAARAPALSQARVVQTAIRLADAEGLSALTMRRVAAELGTAPMSLYYHVKTKHDLLDLMLDATFGEMQFPDRPSGDWRADLSFAARQARDLGRRHLWLMTLLGERPPLGPNFLHHMEFFLAALAGLGLPPATVAAIGSLVDNYVIGFVLSEARDANLQRRSGLNDAQWAAALAPHLQRLLATGRYPTTARLLPALSAAVPEASFEFGLECLLAGIAAQMAGEKAEGTGVS
jgi:AcrR family transcriptional regulator